MLKNKGKMDHNFYFRKSMSKIALQKNVDYAGDSSILLSHSGKKCLLYMPIASLIRNCERS